MVLSSWLQRMRLSLRWLRDWVMPLFLLVMGLGVTAVLWERSGQQAIEKRQSELELMTDRLVGTLESRISSDVHILRGVMGLFHASREIDRDAFQRYVEALSVGDTYPGVQGIGFAQIINPAQQEQHVQAIRAQGFPTYEIKTQGQQELLTSIIYLEPFDERNQRAFGFDMYSEPVRRAAMEHARQTGKAALSGKVRLLQETEVEPQPGTLLYVPIYADQFRPDAAGSELLGWAYAPIRMGTLVRSLLQRELADLLGHLDFALFANTVASEESLLFKTNSFGLGVDNRLKTERTLSLAGQIWLLQVKDLDLSLHNYGSDEQKNVVLMGVLISFLLALLVFMRSRAMLASSMQEIQQAHAIIESSEDAIIGVNMNGIITRWNDSAECLFGYSGSEVIGRSVLCLIPKEQWNEFSFVMKILANGEKVRHLETQRIHKEGHLLDVSVSTSPIFGKNKKVIGFAKIAHDISERKRSDEQIRRLAFHDTLTQLPNRRLLSERLQNMLAMQKRSRQHAALLFMDLDNFKPLNDRHGHKVGDLLLIAVAERLQKCMREGDTVARFGGDEFVVMLSALDNERESAELQAMHCAQKILKVLSTPYQLSVTEQDNNIIVEHSCSASIGGVVFMSEGMDEPELIKRADLAMYQAKEAGRGVVRFFDSHLGE